MSNPTYHYPAHYPDRHYQWQRCKKLLKDFPVPQEVVKLIENENRKNENRDRENNSSKIEH